MAVTASCARVRLRLRLPPLSFDAGDSAGDYAWHLVGRADDNTYPNKCMVRAGGSLLAAPAPRR